MSQLNVTTTKTKSVFIKRKDIIAFLTSEGFKIPDNAGVYTRVPDAGDWFNMDSDVTDEDNVICVKWKEVENEPTHTHEYEVEQFLGRFFATVWIEYDALPGEPVVMYDKDGGGYPGSPPSLEVIGARVTSLSGETWDKNRDELEKSGWAEYLDAKALELADSQIDADDSFAADLFEIAVVDHEPVEDF